MKTKLYACFQIPQSDYCIYFRQVYNRLKMYENTIEIHCHLTTMTDSVWDPRVKPY